jgi:hypothetical protein
MYRLLAVFLFCNIAFNRGVRDVLGSRTTACVKPFDSSSTSTSATRHLDRTIAVAAGAWNHAVALHRCYYRLFGKRLPNEKLQSHLAKLRQTTRRESL